MTIKFGRRIVDISAISQVYVFGRTARENGSTEQPRCVIVLEGGQRIVQKCRSLDEAVMLHKEMCRACGMEPVEANDSDLNPTKRDTGYANTYRIIKRGIRWEE